ncbi:hypothetical protein [Roseobacter sp.]|uniref:hypothetical protein n=1 Tax=Roseobacter sp. TaxID=1907202 RepID=UPI002965FB4B|nr:hypothetical protein [Roseobacter sp.]MDW3181523.1 hypothetical protein [Roseobacter sp.]
MFIRAFIYTLAVIWVTAGASAATLGLTTSAPTIGASGAIDYLEFGPDGDLSLVGGIVTASSLTSLDGPTADLSFGVGFDVADPQTGPAGGFSLFDAQGLYLSGDLIALGFRGFGLRSIVELQFGSLSGRGTPGGPTRC